MKVFLLAMASTVGKPIKVDRNTLKVERGRFARICIEVDLTQPIVGKVWLKGHWYKLEYEGLHLICASCGCYGHLARCCPSIPTATPGGEHLPEKQNGEEGESSASSIAKLVEKTMESVQSMEGPKNVENDLYGEWTIVTRKKCNPIIGKESSKKEYVNNKSSKFVGMVNYVGSDIQGANHGYGNKIDSSPKVQGPIMTVKDAKDWVKPKKRRHDQGSNPFMMNRPSTSKAPLQSFEPVEPKLTTSKGRMGTVTRRDRQKTLVQRILDEPKPPDQDQHIRVLGEDRVLESIKDMVEIPRQLEI